MDAREEHILKRVTEILERIVAFQLANKAGSAVSLEELQQAGVISRDDVRFLSVNGISYTPRALADSRAKSMFRIPTSDGIVFAGPEERPLLEAPRHRGDLAEICRLIVQLQTLFDAPIHDPAIVVEIGDQSAVAVEPAFLRFSLRGERLTAKADSLKTIAAEHDLFLVEEGAEAGQPHIELLFGSELRTDELADAWRDLLTRGLGLSSDRTLPYRSPFPVRAQS